MKLRIRIDLWVLALLGVSLVLLGSGECTSGHGPFGGLSIEGVSDDATVAPTDETPEDRVARLRERLEEIDDEIQLRDIEQDQILRKSWNRTGDESPESVQRMVKRYEQLEEEILDLRAEKEALKEALRIELSKQPIKIFTLTPEHLAEAERKRGK